MSANPGGRISQERLNQIAQRKLTALGIQAKLSVEGTLEGELGLAAVRVTHPTSGAVLTRAGFQVLGHDRLRFRESPFSGLEPVAFYDVESKAMLETRLLQQLQQRGQVLKELGAQLKALGLTSTLDAGILCLLSSVQGAQQRYDLRAGPLGVQVTRVLARGQSGPLPVPDAFPFSVGLDYFSTAAELGAHLDEAKELRADALHESAAAAAPPASQGPLLSVLPAPAGALPLTLFARFADEGCHWVSNELILEAELGGQKYRFSAIHERDSTFVGRLVGPGGEKWKERFDATRFPGPLALMRTVLQIPAPPPVVPATPRAAAATPAAAAAASPGASSGSSGPAGTGNGALPAGLPEHLIPHEGEIWVMSVLVERDENEEMRYVCTNVDGRPYGAARILSKPDFLAVFTPHGTGWRLRIRIHSLDAEGVSYQQLNPQGELSPNVKKVPGAIFAVTFLSEAASY